ncbi:uncharacterized protein LOC131545935 [Onychostoma macrolepis]|uniref:Natural killer cell receptor 2B4 immunoglobulin domain-containing protein n=1 Tax=Onychostoma macrolepis TaxID=369639 RepID=A0A7J6CQK3_9TELE|nr:uncharacterized protein LOC131545935 [Onychostoma macrolepis]KAF4109619.1 hypothetical protein G5714_008871 [Onychostoma macrolepis]
MCNRHSEQQKKCIKVIIRKMPLRRLMLITICVVFITTEAVSDENVKKAVGDEVSFRPTNIDPPVSSITWKHKNSSGFVVKAIEWDADDYVFSTPNQRFKGITALDEKTGQITLTYLTVKHSGLYTIDINSKEMQQRFSLEVMERVPKPVIKIKKVKGNPDVVHLICEYSEPIIWRNSSGEILIGSLHHPKGEFITVEFTGNPDNFYTCTLGNGVSTETSDPVYERDLIQDLWGFVIVSVSMVFIMLFLFIPPCHDYCADCCRRRKTSQK